MVTKNYRINKNRLQIKYYTNKDKNFKWLNIPYQSEINPMLSYIHYNNMHLKKEGMYKKVIENGFFWSGYTKEVDLFIKSCGECYSVKYSKPLDKKPIIIKTYGPHIRYQADLWYLPDELKKGSKYLYVLDVIDHFSKWCYCFLLKNKGASLVLSKIKSFFEINGKPELFHTDNGKEFKNNELKYYLENHNIKYITSAPYHPQSNGCCEALHKEIKKYLLDELDKHKKNFDLEISLVNAIIFHNNRELNSTGYKPVDLRNITDQNIINEVILNIIKSMKRKVDKFSYCVENTLLLVTDDIILKGNRYILKKIKGKHNFVIPGVLLNYINDDTIKIKVSVDIKNSKIFKKDEIINLDINTCRIIDDFGYNYYMELNGVNINY